MSVREKKYKTILLSVSLLARISAKKKYVEKKTEEKKRNSSVCEKSSIENEMSLK